MRSSADTSSYSSQLWPSMVTTSGSTAMPRRAPSSTENITEESVTIFMVNLFLSPAGRRARGCRSVATARHRRVYHAV